MPIQFAMSMSHAPSLFQHTYTGWQKWHAFLNTGHPQPHETELENEKVVAERVERSKANFAKLKQELTKFKPDVVIAVWGDQREWFDAANTPNIMLYTGADTWTVHNTDDAADPNAPFPPPPMEDHKYPVRIDQELASKLLRGLIERGFDVAHADEVHLQSRPERGIPHGWGNIGYHLMPNFNIPTVQLIVNTYDGPPAILNGERCIALGRAVADICATSPKRIAIIGSGGMSHDPRGLRSGWVDEPLDNWFLGQLTAGKVDALAAPFSFRSEFTIDGTGELRCWVVAAAAIDRMKPGHKAVKVDYFPARKVTTGCGWVYWPALDEAKPARKSSAKKEPVAAG